MSSSILYKATAEEVPALRKMSREWVETEGFWDFDSVLAFLGKPFVSIRYVQDEATGDWRAAILYQAVLEQADLIYLYVSPKARRKGLGQILMLDMFEHLKGASKVESLLLEVKEGNAAARNLYEAQGMQMIRRIKRYYKNQEDALVYQKVIDRG